LRLAGGWMENFEAKKHVKIISIPMYFRILGFVADIRFGFSTQILFFPLILIASLSLAVVHE
jgi:hypothetical protein